MALNLYERTRRRRIYDLTITWLNQDYEMNINNINPYRARNAYEEKSVQLRKKQSSLEELDQEKKAIEKNIISIENDIEILIKQGASGELIRTLKNRLQDTMLALQNVQAELKTAKSTFDDFVELKESEYRKVRDKDRIENFDSLRIDFDVSRSCYGGANSMTLKIYNLNLENREMLYVDTFFWDEYDAEKKQIVLKAGYEGDGLVKIFQGLITKCFSYKQGQDIITEMECQSNASTAEHLAQGIRLDKDWSRIDVLRKCIEHLLNTKEGYIDTEALNPAPVKKGTIIANNPINDIALYATNKNGEQMNIFTDEQKIYIIDERNAIIKSNAYVSSISSDLELIGTPVRGNSNITLNCVFQPRVTLAQVFYLNSKIETAFSDINNNERLRYGKTRDLAFTDALPDAIYKIVSINHKGTISDTSAESVITTIVVNTMTHHFKSILPMNIKEK